MRLSPYDLCLGGTYNSNSFIHSLSAEKLFSQFAFREMLSILIYFLFDFEDMICDLIVPHVLLCMVALSLCIYREEQLELGCRISVYMIRHRVIKLFVSSADRLVPSLRYKICMICI